MNLSDLGLQGVEATDALYAGLAVLSRKITQSLIEKYPSLYQWANYISIIVSFPLIVIASTVPKLVESWLGLEPGQIEIWVKASIALGALGSMYNDRREKTNAMVVQSEVESIELTSKQ